jgi:hypothetical protein
LEVCPASMQERRVSRTEKYHQQVSLVAVGKARRVWVTSTLRAQQLPPAATCLARRSRPSQAALTHSHRYSRGRGSPSPRSIAIAPWPSCKG